MNGKVLKHSNISLVYIFTFQEGRFGEINDRVNSATLENKKKTWRLAKINTDEMLPHIAKYYSTMPVDIKENYGTVEKCTTLDWNEFLAVRWKLDPVCANTLWNIGCIDRKINNSINNKASSFTLKNRDIEVIFSIRNINLYIFHGGVGCLVFDSHTDSDKLTDWLNLNHYLRFLDDRKNKFTNAFLGDVRLQDLIASIFRSFNVKLDYALEGGLQPKDKIEIEIDTIFIPNQLVSFSRLFVNSPDGLQGTDYNSWVSEIRYRFKEIFHAKQMIHPSEEHLLSQLKDQLIYAKEQWFIFGLEGGGFLALNPPNTPFFAETLPGHISTYYFNAFLLALYQRFRLLELAKQVPVYWLENSLNYRYEKYTKLRERFLSFSARSNFTQVMQRMHHHEVYLSWRKAFYVDVLNSEVKAAIFELQGFLEDELKLKQLQREVEAEKRLKSFEYRFNVIGFLLLGFVIVSSLFQIEYDIIKVIIPSLFLRFFLIIFFSIISTIFLTRIVKTDWFFKLTKFWDLE